MRQLVLFRHAKAVPSAPDLDDFERELAEAGRLAAPRIAEALAEAGATPKIALVSDARRTRQTWELAQSAFPETKVRYLHSLYLCDAETLMAEAEHARASHVLIVAHNPGLHDLAARLAHRNTEPEMRVRAKFPTAAAAIFGRKSNDASWKLAEFFTPKDLGA
ncbi:MAG: hypothetical protein GC155_01280 [Alphaproteobacteria bacterium]|nr:hypothetical protein [Alphaproteobacteria bacterium]